ncbi:P2Y purinoceptor 4-like [Petromyzon marinus]|uniref:P2Y purinoceptor 4-like n=1 Tax=Petromyzon marinus TaxID=7757 RepID=A0AAJ7U8U3_PETMA|nr:P2Y purinoceptor 4-like [Petromyzon marinus]
MNSSNISNNSVCKLNESYKFIYLPIAYSICAFLGLTLNGFVFWRLAFKTKKWSCNSIYILNLAATDFLYALSLIFLIHCYIIQDVWVFGDLMCRLIRFLFYFNLYSSILFLTAISMYRYLGICHPISTRGLQRLRFAVSICAIIWVFTLLETAPYLYFGGVTKLTPDNDECWDFVPDKAAEHLPYGITLTVLGFILPFFVILIFYSCIIHTLKKSLNEAIIPQTHLRTKRRKSMYTIVVVFTIFVVCHLPYNINKLIFFLYQGNVTECGAEVVSKAYKAVRPLASLNCALNPTLYFVSYFRSHRGRRTQRLATVRTNYGSNTPSIPNNTQTSSSPIGDK